MANTYRSASRDHRAKVAVSLSVKDRRPRGESLACEVSAACSQPAAIIAIRGVPPLMWPAACDGHAAMYR